MAYAVQADLVLRFGEDELIGLTDRENTGVIQASVVERNIADADAEIDGYLAGRYSLPLASVPPILNRLSSDIARYHLYGERVTDTVRKRYEDAVRLLRGLADGSVKLGIDGGSPVDSSTGDMATMIANTPVFSRGY
jgi:phage gp36-like protein